MKKQLLGIDFPQEYLCMGLEENSDFFQVFWEDQDNGIHLDISEEHLFLGYKPLIIGLPFNEEKSSLFAHLRKEITLNFVYQGNTIAHLILQFESEIELGEHRVFLFTGKEASHQFISHFHQMIHRRLEGRIKKKEDPLQLSGNLYDQVRVAYAYPRFISLISLGEKNQFNVFPTDLNGPVGSTHYLVSLRHNGEACAQVDTIKELVLSRVKAEFFEQTYQMGKNHMKPLRDKSEFEFLPGVSHHLQFPVHASSTFYWELEKVGDHTIGIHKIQQFRIALRSEELSPPPTLTHIHNFYAQWRKENNLLTKYLLR